MKITNVTTTMIRNPDGFVFQDATVPQVKRGTRGTTGLWVHIQTDEGIEGLGIGTGQISVRAVIESNLKDILIGQDPFNIEKIWNEMFWRVRGYGRKGIAFHAISAIDIGLWDLKAKALGLPLYRLLNPCFDRVPVYGSGGWTNYTEEELVSEQVAFVERGFPAIKMKVVKDLGQSEKEDIQRLSAVRGVVGDDIEIYVDANNGYSVKQAIRMAREFEDYNVSWFEEPVIADDIDGLASVARAIDIPVASGEHEYTKFGFKELISRNGADIIQPDVCRVGGVTEWMKVAAMAHAFNLPVAPHAVQLVHLHCTMAVPNLKVVEYLGFAEENDRFFYTEFPEPQDGWWAPDPDKLGLGLSLDPSVIAEHAIN